MRPKRKAEAVNFGHENHFTGREINAFSALKHSKQMPAEQCNGCELRDTRIRKFERLTATLAEHIDAMRSREVRR